MAAKDRGNLVRAKIWTAYAGWQAVATGVNIAASVLERKGAVEDHPLFKIQEKMYPALAGKYMFVKDHPIFPGGTNNPRGLQLDPTLQAQVDSLTRSLGANPFDDIGNR